MEIKSNSKYTRFFCVIPAISVLFFLVEKIDIY